MDEVVRLVRPEGERQPNSKELAEARRRWDAVGPAAVVMALSSNYLDPLFDGRKLGTGHRGQGRSLDLRPHAKKWLIDYDHRTKVRDRRAAWGTRITLAMGVITAIAAIIAATPVMQGWLSMLFAGHS